MKLSKKQKIILVAGGVVMYFMSKKTTIADKNCAKSFIDVMNEEEVCEEDLNSRGYYFWNSSNDLFPSGYFHWSNFPSGFGEALDEAGFTSALKHTNSLQPDDPVYIHAQNTLEQYYDGTARLQRVLK